MKIFALAAACLLSLGVFVEAAKADSVLESLVPKRLWQGIPGLERTDGGRLFLTFSGGMEKEKAMEYMVLLCHSDDDGRTWSQPQLMAAPKDGSRGFDGVPWIDPKGRLWYLFNRANKQSGQYAVHARICENPDAPTPVFGPEFRIGFDVPCAFRLNKPIILSTGEWVMPVTFSNEPVHAWNTSRVPLLQGVGISHDEGKTWQLHGAVKAPNWALESMIVELSDGRLWMLIRTGTDFLWESFSSDKGMTWSKGKRSKIDNPSSRFFIRRLASGNLLLVNHHHFDADAKGHDRRSHISARISTNDGKTWGKGLLLDPRGNISYPDGVQDKDGLIWIVYDRDRRGASEILMARFREEDAVNGKNASGRVVLRQLIHRNPPTHP